MKMVLVKISIGILLVYSMLCAILYFYQEKVIFFPQRHSKDYKFRFDQNFQELTIQTRDGKALSALLFKSDVSKGVIFYLHGNAGSLASWGDVANTYTDLNYDVYMLDYRGYGKSEGVITSQTQFYEDVQLAYDELKKTYAENKIIILGYSIGTGSAAKLASVNHPRLLILQAPYYSLVDMMKQNYPILPAFILKYKFETNTYLQTCQMPIIIFHGDQDEVIYYESSLKLKEKFKKGDTLIPLYGQSHNGITDNETYKTALRRLLN